MRFLKYSFVALFSIAGPVLAAEQAPFNSSTISGLGARNIGSAAMSGRVSAIAATREPSGKLTIFVGAASGGVWKSEDGGTRYKPIFDEQPIAHLERSTELQREAGDDVAQRVLHRKAEHEREKDRQDQQ